LKNKNNLILNLTNINIAKITKHTNILKLI